MKATPSTTDRRGKRLLALSLAAFLGAGAAGCVLDAPFETQEIRTEAFDAFHRGEQLAERGRYAQALDEYLLAIELSPRPAFLQRAGAMHRELGNPDRALFYFDRALEMQPDFEAASAERELARLEIAGDLLERGRPELAYAFQNADAAETRNEVEPFTAPASPAESEASTSEPREIATAAETMTPEDFRRILFPELEGTKASDLESVRAEATAATEGGRWLSAVNLWGRLASLEPENVETRLEFARALEKSGRVRRALEEFQAVSELFPDEGEVWYRYGNALANAGRYGRAEESYRRAAELDPGNAMIRNNLGALYLNAGRFQAAAAEFGAAIEADPTMAAPHLNMALALDGSGGDASAALWFLEQYLALGGERRRDAEEWLVDLRARSGASGPPAVP